MSDQVSEVYKGLLYAEKTQKQLQERIHWVISHVRGNKILDVGCSQGISCILLGRLGYNVIGIDQDSEAINYASNDLKKELESVQKKVTFLEGDVLQQNFTDQDFDCIILGEIIEHLSDPKPLIEACYQFLNDQGIMIITTPFGVLRHPDHFQTYYISNFLALVSPYLELEKLEIVGKRICYQGYKRFKITPNIAFNKAELLNIISLNERNFLEIENNYLTELANCKARSSHQQEALKQYRTRLNSKQEKLNEYRVKLEAKQEKLEQKQLAIKSYQNKITKLEENIRQNEIKSRILKALKRKIKQPLKTLTNKRKTLKKEIIKYFKNRFRENLHSSGKINLIFLSLITLFYTEGKFPLADQLYKKGLLFPAYKKLQSCTNPNQKIILLRDRIEEMLEVLSGKAVRNFVGEKTPRSVEFNQRVLFALHNSLPYDSAGYALRSHAILTTLADQNINVLAATRLDYPWDLNKHAHRSRDLESKIDGISYRRLTAKEVTYGRVKDSIYVEQYAMQLVSLARSHQASVIHGASNFLNGLAAIQAARKLGIFAVYEVRGLWHLSRASKETNFEKTELYRYQETMEKLAVQEADAVVVISEALKKELTSWGVTENKISVIPNAVDLNKFSLEPPNLELKEKLGIKDCFVIGFLGSLTAYEGLDLLVKAVVNLQRKDKPIALVIVGDGQSKEILEKVAQKTPRPDRIIFTGRVPFTEVNQYYSIFDLCPLPRKSYEVCQRVPPLKILEILAMGKPTIVSNLPPLLEIIEDQVTGRVCQADSVTDLETVILELYDNPDLRTRFAEAGRIWVEKNRSWDVISEKIRQIYEALATTSSTAS